MVNARHNQRKFLAVFAIFFCFAWADFAGASKPPPIVELCHGIKIEGEIQPGLTGAEKRLICGDPETDAWKTIPPPQMRYNMKNFLEQRGFFHPQFEDNLIRIGAPTIVTKFSVEGAPDSLKPQRKRKVVGEVLKPDLLNDVEKWIVKRLRGIGYPCPEVKAVGDPDTGEIVAQIKTGPLQNLVEVVEQPIPGVGRDVIQRYDAFVMGHRFNGDNLDLTADRLSKNLFDSAYFLPECGPNGAIARENVVPGPPRTFSIGGGFDTEGLLLGSIAWKNSRVGKKASSVQVSLFASTKEQHLVGLLNAYVFSDPGSRSSIVPDAEFWHQNQPAFETITSAFQIEPRTTWDGDKSGLTAQIGPRIESIRTLRGPGPATFHSLLLDGSITWMSHDFEFYQTNPRSGYSLSGSVDLNDVNLFSTVTAERFGLRFERLWNLNQYDPPLWIFGLRSGGNTTLTGQRPTQPSSLLPPTYTYFLGGSPDVRGFGLQELPKSGVGALTAVFADFEARLSSVFPANLQPFGFVDLGMLGTSPFNVTAPIFWSPGIGIRWDPGFGAIRATMAHGYPSDIPGHWQFYFSFGEEF